MEWQWCSSKGLRVECIWVGSVWGRGRSSGLNSAESRSSKDWGQEPWNSWGMLKHPSTILVIYAGKPELKSRFKVSYPTKGRRKWRCIPSYSIPEIRIFWSKWNVPNQLIYILFCLTFPRIILIINGKSTVQWIRFLLVLVVCQAYIYILLFSGKPLTTPIHHLPSAACARSL